MHKKSRATICDFNDATFGNPAILIHLRFWETCPKRAIKTRGFPPQPRDGFGFILES